jgi:hypothetical protein
VTRSDARGRYRLNALPDSFFAEAGDAGRTSILALTAGRVPAQAYTDLDFTLIESGRYEGRVLAPDGDPLSGVEVSAVPVSGKVAQDPYPGFRLIKPARSARSGARGRFVLEDLPRGRHYVVATEPPYVSAWTCATAGGGEPLDLRLGRGAALALTVLGANGAPLAGAGVSVWRGVDEDGEDIPHGHPEVLQETRTDAEGHAVLEGQRPGASLVVQVAAPGHATRILGPLAPPLEDTLRLQASRALTGRIRRSSGGPLAEATAIVRPALDYGALEALGLHRYCEQSIVDHVVPADPDGAFTSADAPSGALEVLAVARADDGAWIVESRRIGDERVVEIVLEEPDGPACTTAAGRVVDARTAVGVDHARIEAWSQGRGVTAVAGTDAAGTFRLSLPAADDWVLTFTHEGYARGCVELERSEPALDVGLHPRCSLPAVVLDAERVPLPAARVEVFGDDGTPVLGGVRLGRGFEPADPLGRVQFLDLPARKLRLAVLVPELAHPRFFDVDATYRRDDPSVLVLEDFVSTLPARPVALAVRRDPERDAAGVSWSAPAAGLEPYAGPLELTARDPRGRIVLELEGRVGPRGFERAPPDLRSLNFKRRAYLRDWSGRSPWDVLPAGDALSALPLPAHGGELAIRVGEVEVEVALPDRPGSGKAALTVLLPGE